MKKHDVIIMGGGPGGSVLASFLAREGFDVGLFEREIYPRFHIGESLLPSSMPIFKEIGFYDTLNSGKYIQKYGARFVDYRVDEEIYFGFENGFNPEIPMAFEVPRSEFDKDLLEHAKKCGVTVYQPERIKNVNFHETHVHVVTDQGEYEAPFVADATGRESILGKQFKLRIKNEDLNNVAVFSHFTNVKRGEGKSAGDIIIGMLPNQSWSWVIPFKGDVTSVGVVCHSSLFKGESDLDAYLRDRFSASPKLKEYMQAAERIGEVTVISNYSHRCESFAGDRWILIGDSALFLDPIFSSGVHMASSSAKFASQVLTKALRGNKLLTHDEMDRKYKDLVELGAKRFHSMISLFYKSDFMGSMKKTLAREHTRQAFTSAVAGDVWNDQNMVFKMDVL